MTAAIQCPTFKPTLRLGNNGQDVKELQKRLNQRFASIYTPSLEIDIDGDFGSQTETAVNYLQCLAFLPVTGISDAATWNFICDGVASLPVLKLNSKGNTVKAVQQALCGMPPALSSAYRGFYSGAIDGSFGSGTVQAVKDFQSFYSLKVDAVIGAGTWTALIKMDSHRDRCYSTYYGGC
ncbi:peptidoglycan-binding domain-containing protein [Brunnivagina elsteri]|uniref:Peptidoglycan-binding protein n=1 Tax=Brunnivagina elsteri CCALA 953 TaxID=987040 RepID=A0A2A2TGY8_9CYAN|nr:peptidoglycan-binding protein [Calothrix elsteri]PAX52992.1 peptidoglycan-binding protein [Calothrix elsteri CCALA 953]